MMGIHNGHAGRGLVPFPPVLILLLLFAAPALPGQAIELRVRASGNTISADLVFQWEKKEDILKSVRGGLGSRVEFLFRVREKKPSFLPFFREVLVSQSSLSRSAYFDIFSNEYSMTSESEGRTFFAAPEDFLRRFLCVNDLAVFAGLRPGTSYAVAVQVRLTPTRLVPPLNIISLWGGMAPFTSPWVQQEIAP
jgi:hypothetical protein